jgi:hypothetical protein
MSIVQGARLNFLLFLVEILRDRALEAWKSCPRKKLVAGTAVTMCWNMFSVKTRIIAGIYADMVYTVGITL